jgi:hypothetical protein
MSFLVGSDGNLSLFRVGTVIGAIGILLLIGGVAAYVLDQNSYKTPLNVEPYPGAETWGTPREQGASRRVVYKVDAGSPDEVAAYYSQKLNDFGGDTSCVRTPQVGTAPGSESDPSIVPFTFRCLFQRTGLGVSQQTVVTIQPGVFNADPLLNTQGATVIEHNQTWQP